MRDVLGKLGRHGLVFSVGLLLSRFAGFVVLPFLTRALEEWQYGVHDLLAQTGQLVGMVAALGLPSAVFRWHIYQAESEEERRRAIATGFRCTLVSSLVVGLVAALPARGVAAVLTGRDGYAGLYALVLLTYAMQNLRNVCIAVLRAQYRSWQFLAVFSAEFLLCVGLNLLFCVHYRMGVAGLIWSNLIGASVALSLGLAFVPAVFARVFDRALLRQMLAFSLPLVPQALAFFLLDVLDRYCLNALLDPERARAVIGLYGRGAAFASVLHAVLIMPLTTLWPNVFYELAKRESGPRDIGRCASYYVAVAGFLTAGLAACAEPLVRLMTDARYHDAHLVVPILALSIFLFGLNEFPRVPFLVRARTGWLPLLVGAAVVCNLAFNVALVPRFGMLGAAWSSVLSYAVLVALHHLRGRRFLAIRYEPGRMLRAAAASLVALGAAFALPRTSSAVIDLFARGGLVAVGQPLLLLLLGFFGAADRRFLGDLLRRRGNRGR